MSIISDEDIQVVCRKCTTRKESFQQRKTFDERVQEVRDIEEKYPNKIPVIFEKSKNEKKLPDLDKSKFLLPQDMTVAQFMAVFRERLAVPPNHSFFLIINKKTLASMKNTLKELYAKEKDVDGFLYITYASQNAFGSFLPPSITITYF